MLRKSKQDVSTCTNFSPLVKIRSLTFGIWASARLIKLADSYRLIVQMSDSPDIEFETMSMHYFGSGRGRIGLLRKNWVVPSS